MFQSLKSVDLNGLQRLRWNGRASVGESPKGNTNDTAARQGSAARVVPTFGCVGVLLLLLAMPASANDISVEELQGITVHFSFSYVGRFRNDRGEAPGGFTTDAEIKIGPGATIQSTFTRNTYADTPRGRITGSLTRSGESEIGKSRELMDGSGAAVWLIEGDTLISLRAFEVGGFVIRIRFEKSGEDFKCSANTTSAREAGAGLTTDQSAMSRGGKVRIISLRQTSTTCRVSRAG